MERLHGQAEANPSSPHSRSKTKRPRGKYSSKACVQCRERKLKCSGNDPCQRCARGGHPCLFSDDPAVAAEFLRRNNPILRRAKSSSNSATSDMEIRLAKMESALQTLVEYIPHRNDRNSLEPHQTDGNDGFRGETAFEAPVDTFNANLAPLREQLGYQETAPSSPSWQADGNDCSPEAASVRTTSSKSPIQGVIRFGQRNLPFPPQAEYERYLDFSFDDINTCHPCLNETEFRSKCQTLLTTRKLDPQDACLLAMNYILFACTDILTYVGPTQKTTNLPGWQWYLAADELMRKRKMNGQGDLSLIQFLVYEALYLVHADNANAAYNISGLACRLCFQFGLHQQRLWGPNCSAYSQHMRQRLFWTVYFVDRRVSMSCGRPYGIRDSDIEVDSPAWLDDKTLHSDRAFLRPDPENSYMTYLACMIAFARFAGEVWDQAFSVASAKNGDLGEKIAILDARIQYWLDVSLPTIPLLPRAAAPLQRHLRYQSLVRTRMSHLRLLLRRRSMVSLSYSSSDATVCGMLAIDIVQDMQTHASEIEKASSFRFHMATTLGSAIIILATLLCRDLSIFDLKDQQSLYAESYRNAISMLRDLAVNLHSAARILKDLKEIIKVVDLVVQQDHSPRTTQDGLFMDLVPPNMDNMFPYDPISSNLLFTASDWGSTGVIAGNNDMENVTSTVQGNNQNMEIGWESWEDAASQAPGDFGVPWV